MHYEAGLSWYKDRTRRILQSLEKKMMGRRVTGVKMTSSCLSALVARLRVRGGDRGAAHRGWLRPVDRCTQTLHRTHRMYTLAQTTCYRVKLRVMDFLVLLKLELR